MSFATVKWARAIDLDRSAKAVLVDLAFRANEANECWPGHERIAETLNVSKDTIERAIKRLRTTGLITVRQRYDKRGKRTSNCYKLNVGATPDELRNEKAKTVRVLGRTVRSTKPHHAGDRITDQSLETPKERKEEAFKESFNRSAETDNSTRLTHQLVRTPIIGGNSRVPFTESVLKKIAGLGVDLEALIERYMTKTRNRDIKNPCAYLLCMAQEEAAKAAGVSIDVVKRLNSSSNMVRAAAFGSVTEGTLVAPSEGDIARLERRLKPRGLDATELVERWKATKPRCTTAAAAARSLEAFVTNEIHRARDELLHNGRRKAIVDQQQF